MEATLLLAAIAQHYRIRLASHQRVEPLASITLRPKNGIRVTLEERMRTPFASDQTSGAKTQSA